MTQQRTSQCGSFTFKWGESITEMDDSTNLLSNLPLLRSKLENDGYILLRQQIDANLIDSALNVVAKNLHETWKCIDIKDDERKLDDLYVSNNCDGILLTGYKPVTHHQNVLSLLHCNKLINLMNKIFDFEPVTHDTKWVRVKGTNEFTDEHSDYYRFSDCWRNMVTVWMPLMDIPIHRGPLAVCPKSHLLPFETNYDYGMEQKSEIEVPPDFDQFNKNAIWKSTDFKKGDLLIFDIRLIHASIINQTKQFRVSIDTRWQPKHSITYWNSSYIRFKQFQNKNVKQIESQISTFKLNLNSDKDGDGEKDDEDEEGEQDIMMDCSFTDSDNEVINSLDFEEIVKRHSNYNNSPTTTNETAFV